MKNRCQHCAEPIRPHDGVHLVEKDGTPGTLLCGRCYNEIISHRMGIDFDHPEFKAITHRDCRGRERHFEFRTHLFGHILKIDALEIRDGEPQGYEFTVCGDAEADPMELFKVLYGRLRSELGRRYLTDSESPQIADGDVVRGRIEWDDRSDQNLPRLVIDGREISWMEMGRMMMSYEGWRFSLEIFDSDDVVEAAGQPSGLGQTAASRDDPGGS